MIRSYGTGFLRHPRPALMRDTAARRCGFLMVEVLIAALLIGTTMAVLLPGMVSVRRQRLDQRFEVLAMIELNNVSELVRGGESSPRLNAWFQDRYRAASLATEALPVAELTPEGSGLRAGRISIRRPKS
ncbi:MAG: hypothetical protein ACK58L_11400, partial [Planctomycetota bacterium]